MKSFVLMLTFMTRIPVPVKFEFNEEDFAKGLLWMPVIGMLIGVPLYLFAAYVPLDNEHLTSFLLMLIYLLITGGLHLDGLADYADGAFSGRDRERILEIMKDSSIGSFGVIGLCLYFIGIYTGMLFASPMSLLLMPVVARTIGLSMCAFGRYPKKEGMGKGLVDYGQWYHGVLAIVIVFGIVMALGVNYFVAATAVGVFMSIFFIRAMLVIGGITGDVVGASVEVSQVLWLLTLGVIGGLS